MIRSGVRSLISKSYPHEYIFKLPQFQYSADELPTFAQNQKHDEDLTKLNIVDVE